MTGAITTLTVFATIPAVGFVATYARMPWYRSMVGRGVMILVVALCELIGMGVLRIILGTDYALRTPLVLFVYFNVGCGLWVMFVALLRIRRDQRTQFLGDLASP